MAVTDLRDLIGDATTNTDWTDDGGAGSISTNTDTTPPGVTTVLSDKVSNDLDGIIFDDGGTNTFADTDTIYIWYNTIFGPLNTVALGGVRAYFAGATITDFFSVIIDGTDSGRTGWQLVAINIGKARSSPDFTGGTPPTAANIEQIGVQWDMISTVGGNNDNVAIGNIYRQTAAQGASYRVDAGTDGTPNTWQTIADGVNTDGTGIVIKNLNGTFSLSGGILFGPDSGDVDTTFVDEGVVLAWVDYPLIDDDFYELRMDLPGSYAGDARITAGNKIGTGADAVGVAGWTILTGRPRYKMTFENADQTDVQFYGCSFFSSSTWAIDDTAVEILSCNFDDCDTLTFTAGSTGPAAVSKCFFAAAPGPQAQCIINQPGSPTDFSTDQFTENSFVNMIWFGMDFTAASLASPNGITLKGFLFSNNGTNRDILTSNDTGDSRFLVTGAGDSPGVTNGSTINITTVGTVDNLLYSVITFDEVQQVGGGTDASADGTLDVTGNTLTVDDDTFAVWAATPFGDLTSDGTGDNYTDGKEIDSDVDEIAVLLGYPDELTPSTTARRANSTLSVATVDSVVALIEVIAENGSTPVTLVDPEFRPWVKVDSVSTTTFGYGAGDDATNPNRKTFVIAVAQAGVAADTAISTITIDTGAGNTALSSREVAQDDNVGATGNSLEASIFSLANTDEALDQGNTPVVEANVTTTFTNIRSDSEFRLFDVGTANEITGTESVTGGLVEAQLVNAGTGYVASETLTLVGGTFTTAAVITIDTVGGSGEILTFSVTTLGSYTVDASSPNSPSGGSGSDAEFDIVIRGVFDFTFNAATQGNFDIVAHHLDFVYLKLFNQIPATADGSIPINQRTDRNFSNP